MVRAGSPPGGQRLASGLLRLLPPVATAVCTIVAVIMVSSGSRAPVAWCGVVATAAVALVAAEAARRGRVIAEQRAGHAERESMLRRRLSEQEAETVRLAEEMLPQAVARLQRGELAEEVLSSAAPCDAGLSPEFLVARQAVLRSVLDAVKAEEDLRDSAQRAFVNIARRVQAIIHQQAQDLRDMEDKHGGDPDVFGDLLHLDHGTALIGRLADSIAVLGGARPGRQWQQNVPLFNVLRGAMSRIIDYQRVELHSVTEVAVVGPAVEPLIHALAELLDNATRYSPPRTRVHLTATEIQAGVAVEIEDGGVGLTEEARGRAERVLAQASAGLDLNDLGETPRLGLAVVGRLSQANNFQVSLRPSAYGGVRAVLIIPADLITAVPASAGSVPGAGSIGVVAGANSTARPTLRATGGPVRAEPVVVRRNANGLPQRRRRAPASRSAGATGAAPAAKPTAAKPTATKPAATPTTAAPASVTAPEPAAPSSTAAQPGMWLAAFQDGVSGKATAADAARGSDESLDEGEQ
jgi:signal transduction histidine kinase